VGVSEAVGYDNSAQLSTPAESSTDAALHTSAEPRTGAEFGAPAETATPAPDRSDTPPVGDQPARDEPTGDQPTRSQPRNQPASDQHAKHQHADHQHAEHQHAEQQHAEHQTEGQHAEGRTYDDRTYEDRTTADRAGPPVGPEPEPEPEPEPDVMVLPEPDDRNRPTVSLDRSPVPGQGRLQHTEPLPRSTGDPVTDARLEKLENSPFWLDNPEHGGTRRLPEVSSHAGRRRRVRKGAIRKPAPALFALITLALVATFFAWVSAEPFWLAVGHGDRGYATTTACSGSGVVQRCAGRFAAADGSFEVSRVGLLGVTAGQRAGGAVTPARMVSADSRMAYVGDTSLLVHLRWVLGFVLVLMCGYGIARLTGARRLDDPRARRLVILASVLGPVALLAGFLAAAY
jgi:hypothetical protein